MQSKSLTWTSACCSWSSSVDWWGMTGHCCCIAVTTQDLRNGFILSTRRNVRLLKFSWKCFGATTPLNPSYCFPLSRRSLALPSDVAPRAVRFSEHARPNIGLFFVFSSLADLCSRIFSAVLSFSSSERHRWVRSILGRRSQVLRRDDVTTRGDSVVTCGALTTWSKISDVRLKILEAVRVLTRLNCASSRLTLPIQTVSPLLSVSWWKLLFCGRQNYECTTCSKYTVYILCRNIHVQSCMYHFGWEHKLRRIRRCLKLQKSHSYFCL